MELDADRYEAYLNGSTHFRDAALVRLLAHAFDDVYQKLGESCADRKLVDSFPRLIARRAQSTRRNISVLPALLNAIVRFTRALGRLAALAAGAEQRLGLRIKLVKA